MCNLTEEPAITKTTGRITAFNNIRNLISFCSLLATLEEYVTRENYYSVDDVSVVLNQMGTKPTVVTTEEAKSLMKELNLSISTNEKAVKQRVVTFNCTISGDFKMTVICIKFVDRTFTQYQERPLILQLEDRLYIALYQYGMSDEVVNKYIYSEVIIPSTLQNREILLTTHSPAERYQMIAIAQDGANGQIQEYHVCKICRRDFS